MRVTLNGDATEADRGTSVGDVVARLGADPSATAVACNGDIVPRSEWARELAPGDVVEVVSAAPGG